MKDPKSFWYKIPDTGKLGGKKPFDGFLVMNKIFFAIEFKIRGSKPTPYQRANLARAKMAGGESFVIYDTDDMDKIIDNMYKFAY